jgi:hypothetical protein
MTLPAFPIFLAGAPVLALATACITASTTSGNACTVRHIEEIVRNAVAHAGEIFCGEVLAVNYRHTARLLTSPDETTPSNDLAFLITNRTRGLLPGLSDTPRRYYIEARIDPQTACFVPSGSGEECVPYRRPIDMHVLAARSLP